MTDYHPALKDVHPDNHFYVRDGPRLKNLYELERELRRMTDSQFLHHVNDSKNDFYNWIFHVVKDERLSMQLAQVKDRNAMADIVERRIAQLEDPPKDVKPVQKIKREKPATPVKKAAKPVKRATSIPKMSVKIPKVEIPKVSLPAFAVPELPPAPAVAPLPLTFEEVEAKIRQKVGEMPEVTRIEPIRETSMSLVHERTPVHHRIKHHVRKHAAHYGTLALGLVLGLAIAKWFV